MLLGLITLLTALFISGIAAYYSIVGLTAIFAAAVTPVILMGGVLEVGKVVTTLWLHYNWERAPWKIRSYLVSAVGILMLITSMGIFGFLSKAHLEQAVPSGDVQAQVALFDEKIKTQRDNIESDRKALAQLDAAVDQTMARTDTEQGATKSANLRQSQKKDRTRYQNSIDEAQKTIAKLQEERAPVASKLRKVEAEVGPIKYIAALIYGDKADQNMLEAAVRWVIIIIVAVFDPLAIILLLAATTSIDWSKLDRRKKIDDTLTQQIEELRKESEEIITSLKATHADDLSIVAKETRANVEAELLPLVEAERNRVIEIQAIVVQQQELVKANSELMDTQNAKFAELDKAVRDMADDLDSARDQLSEMEDDREISSARIDELTEALSTIDDELLASKADLESLAARYADLKLSSEEISQHLREMTVAHQALMAEREQLANELTVEKGLTEELAKTIEERNTEITRLMEELDERMREIEQLIAKLAEKDVEIEAAKAVPAITIPDEVLSAYDDERLVSKFDKLAAVDEEEELVLEEPFVPEPFVSTELTATLNPINWNESFPIVEEQPPSGTLTDPQVAEKALDAVFTDRPEYFAPKTVEPVEETIEDLPSNEQLLQHAADTKDEFYKSLFETIDAMPAPESTVQAVPKRMALPPRKNPPKLSAVPDNFPMGGNASFGTQFPANPIKGDLFLRVDYMPSKLYKWVGSRWIEMDKSTSDTYAYDQEYIKLLVEKVGSGEYDIDDLSQMEQDQIAEYLSKN